MVWEDIEEDEHELLEANDGEARQMYYGALSRSMIGYIIAIGMVLLLLFFAAAIAFWLGGT